MLTVKINISHVYKFAAMELLKKHNFHKPISIHWNTDCSNTYYPLPEWQTNRSIRVFCY